MTGAGDRSRTRDILITSAAVIRGTCNRTMITGAETAPDHARFNSGARQGHKSHRAIGSQTLRPSTPQILFGVHINDHNENFEKADSDTNYFSQLNTPRESSFSWHLQDATIIFDLGHKRTSGPVIGECKLCRQTGPLLLSHLVPRWAIRGFTGGGSQVTHSRLGGSILIKTQDGIKEYLLCASCEQYLGIAENYLKDFCSVNVNTIENLGLSLTHSHQVGGTNPHQIFGINRKLLLRSLLGILFKQHVSKSEGYQVPLDAALVKRLRSRILTDDYPHHNYALHAIKWFNFQKEGFSPRDSSFINSGVRKGYTEGHVMIGGMSFFLSFTSHNSVKNYKRVQNGRVFLDRSDPWHIWCADLLENLTHNDYFYPDGVLASQVGPWGVDPSGPCPCGSEDESKECCLDLWFSREWYEQYAVNLRAELEYEQKNTEMQVRTLIEKRFPPRSERPDTRLAQPQIPPMRSEPHRKSLTHIRNRSA